MKSLDQVEPRIDLQNAPASAVTTTAPAYHYIITQPGSYYLTANIAATKPNAVEITAVGVTLDLNGFQISRASGTGGNGIEVISTAHGAHIHNGSVTGFADGILCDVNIDRAHCSLDHLDVSGCTGTAILAGTGSVLQSCRAHDNNGVTAIFTSHGSVLSNCTADNNTGNYAIETSNGCTLLNCAAYKNTAAFYAIATGYGNSLSNCTAYNNTAGTALLVGSGCSLINCSAWGNTAGTGIFSDPGSTLTGCTASENTSSDANSYGFYINNNCTIVGCTARANTSSSGSPGTLSAVGMYVGSDSTVKNCTATSNKGDGIHASQRSQIIDCTGNSNGNGTNGSGIVTDIRAIVRHCSASDNQKNGIVVLGASTVSENSVNHNGVGGPAAGIDSSGGFGSRIEGNQARDNIGTGILTSSVPGDLVIRNSAGGPATATPYAPSSGPNFGTLQPPSGATNPMANVVF